MVNWNKDLFPVNPSARTIDEFNNCTLIPFNIKPDDWHELSVYELKELIRLLDIEAKKGDPRAVYQLSALYREGVALKGDATGVEKDIIKALEYAEILDEMDYPLASFSLASIYWEVDNDIPKAQKYTKIYLSLVDSGMVPKDDNASEHHYLLGYTYWKTEKNFLEAARHFKKAVEGFDKANPFIIKCYATSIAEGWAGNQDIPKAIRILKEVYSTEDMAKKLRGDIAYQIGMLLEGDSDEQMKWMTESVAQGNQDAKKWRFNQSILSSLIFTAGDAKCKAFYRTGRIIRIRHESKLTGVFNGVSQFAYWKELDFYEYEGKGHLSWLVCDDVAKALSPGGDFTYIAIGPVDTTIGMPSYFFSNHSGVGEFNVELSAIYYKCGGKHKDGFLSLFSGEGKKHREACQIINEKVLGIAEKIKASR